MTELEKLASRGLIDRPVRLPPTPAVAALEEHRERRSSRTGTSPPRGTSSSTHSLTDASNKVKQVSVRASNPGKKPGKP